MLSISDEVQHGIIKVILYILFISSFITIIAFVAGQGWFGVLIERLHWSYDTLEVVRNMLVQVFIGAGIVSFLSSISAVTILLFGESGNGKG
jgi:hypothetical protein